MVHMEYLGIGACWGAFMIPQMRLLLLLLLFAHTQIINASHISLLLGTVVFDTHSASDYSV